MLFDEVIHKLDSFFKNKDCIVLQPYSIAPIGAATFHPATVLYTLSEERWNVCWAQECHRPADSRSGNHPTRRQKFYQYQVIMKPAPEDTLKLIRDCLNYIGIKVEDNDIKFVKDDWESPTLGATGIGWEVWCNGVEICQLTYMQKLASVECDIVPLEISFGLERLITYIQRLNSFSKIKYLRNDIENNNYNKILQREETEFAKYNTDLRDVKDLMDRFLFCQTECDILLNKNLSLPAYKFCCEATDIFNTLCAKGVLNTDQKKQYILDIRELVKKVAHEWLSKY